MPLTWHIAVFMLMILAGLTGYDTLRANSKTSFNPVTTQVGLAVSLGVVLAVGYRLAFADNDALWLTAIFGVISLIAVITFVSQSLHYKNGGSASLWAEPRFAAWLHLTIALLFFGLTAFACLIQPMNQLVAFVHAAFWTSTLSTAIYCLCASVATVFAESTLRRQSVGHASHSVPLEILYSLGHERMLLGAILTLMSVVLSLGILMSTAVHLQPIVLAYKGISAALIVILFGLPALLKKVGNVVVSPKIETILNGMTVLLLLLGFSVTGL